MIGDLDFSLAQLGQTKAFIGSSFFFDSVVEVNYCQYDAGTSFRSRAIAFIFPCVNLLL